MRVSADGEMPSSERSFCLNLPYALIAPDLSPASIMRAISAR